ncbi:MAG: CPBP family intramembrane metalloprotease [Acidobacteria bacterium]|nr:CPBP family intramembrane metalloprotease [Acidobacteriota bacterium]
MLAYGLSWGSYYLLSGPFLFPLGAFLAALIMAGVTGGRGGLKDLLKRCVRWRVGLRWYAAALCVPVAIYLSTMALGLLLGVPRPRAEQFGHWYSLFLFFPVALIDAPLWEEPAWRGYALPRFSDERSPLANTLLLGLLLAGWHVPIALSGGKAIAAPYLIATVASAVVTNWIYYNARESALFAILYHTAANALSLYLFSMFSGPHLLKLYWLLAAVNWFVALMVMLLTGRTLQGRTHAKTAPVRS